MSQSSTPTAPTTASQSGVDWRLIVMCVCAAACVLPWISPPRALGIGVVLALLGWTSHTKMATKIAKYMIQVAVVMLGLGMDLRQVGEAGMMGLAFAAGTIVGTFALGIALGKLLKIDAKLTTLLSSGTAICGGSAIAATASVIGAAEAHIAVAMGAVFLLNAVAIYIFPYIGHEIAHLSAHQFGTWAAVAIHDVSSVVTTAGEFDKHWPDATNPGLASQTATAVKLTRTLWIAPVAMVCAWWFRDRGTGVLPVASPGSSGLPAHDGLENGRSGSDDAPEAGAGQPTPHNQNTGGTPVRRNKAKIPIPWFVLWFVVAAGIGTLFGNEKQLLRAGETVPLLNHWVSLLADFSAHLAKEKLMSIALFLIGCGLSPKAVMSVGWKAMVMAVVLWIGISVASLWVVMHATT